jgi:hypothetical protein
MSMTFRERLAWLGRMPRHYKLLFGSQLLFTIFAFRMRQKLIERQGMERKGAPSQLSSSPENENVQLQRST